MIPKSVVVCRDISDVEEKALVWASEDLCRLLTYGVCMSSPVYYSLL